MAFKGLLWSCKAARAYLGARGSATQAGKSTRFSNSETGEFVSATSATLRGRRWKMVRFSESHRKMHPGYTLLIGDRMYVGMDSEVLTIR